MYRRCFFLWISLFFIIAIAGCNGECDIEFDYNLDDKTITISSPINVVYTDIDENINKSSFMISPAHKCIMVKYVEGNFSKLKIYLYDSLYEDECIQVSEIKIGGEDVIFSNLTQEKAYIIGFEVLEGDIGGGEEITLLFSD